MSTAPRVNPWDRYRGLKKWGWYLDDLASWERLLHTKDRVRVLEVGAFDGVSANLMLDLLFTHPESELHAIDPFLPDPTTPEVNEETRLHFEENLATGGHAHQIRLYEGLSAEVLAWMIAEDGYWESFDFIYIDGSHLAKDVFIDAALSWNLLKPGAIVAFDDYEWGNWRDYPTSTPRASIDSFASIFSDHADLIHQGSRAFFLKLQPFH